MHRQKQILGYGVMVTLQILVLSFLVRIQVAQLKRLSSEGRFFCVFWFRWLVARGGCFPTLGCLKLPTWCKPQSVAWNNQCRALPLATFTHLYCRSGCSTWFSLYAGWADMIVIYCSAFSLRFFYKVSALRLKPFELRLSLLYIQSTPNPSFEKDGLVALLQSAGGAPFFLRP